MSGSSLEFGIAMRNFVRYPDMPDAQGLIEYGVRMEELGFDSLWVWDHILLGVDPNFPIHDSLSIITAVAARTERIKLGTGILILPARNALVLAKQASTIDHISRGRLILGLAAGWYKREFDAIGVDFHRRGKLMDINLDVMTRLWTESSVTGEFGPYNLKSAVMYPKPYTQPRPTLLIGGYVDRVLKRAATRGDGWLTYFYTPEGFTKSWNKILRFAEEAGRDPGTLKNANQLPIMVGDRTKIEAPMREWLTTEWDQASWSDSTIDSAIIGSVDECIDRLQAQLEVGVQKIIFVPYRYEMEQIEIIASEIVPRLRGG